MSENQNPHPLIRSETVQNISKQTFSHPLNPNSQISGISLSDRTGMQRLGFHLVRISPGKESFIYHSHQLEEEFIYILSGRGVVEINDREFEVGAGDFMGFPTPNVAHHLRNPFEEDLVYLMGGERREIEIADFPRRKKRLFRIGNEVHSSDWDNLKPLGVTTNNREEK